LEKTIILLKALSGEVKVALPSRSYKTKKLSMPDISYIAKDITKAKSGIINQLFDVAIYWFCGKRDNSI
jgi:hypothetical protein